MLILIAIVENVAVGDSLGTARVFDDEAAAEIALSSCPNSQLICYGGYYNAVWQSYD